MKHGELRAGTDKSGTRGKRKTFYTVKCDKHGTKRMGDIEKTVSVAPVWGRKAKNYGCPHCRKENRVHE